MPKKLTIIGVLAALVLGIVGFAQQGVEAYTAQSFCTGNASGPCPAGALPIDALICYGGTAPTALGACGGGGSSATTIPAGNIGLPITTYTQLIVPPGSRTTLPVYYTPKTWGYTSPTRCVNDETVNTCAPDVTFPSSPNDKAFAGPQTPLGATSQTGGVTALTDLLCDGLVDVLSNAPAVTASYPAGGADPFLVYRTYDTVSGPPVGADPNAYVTAIQPMPQSFPFVSIDKSRFMDLYLGGVTDLNLHQLTGEATPLQVLSRDTSYTTPNGVTLSIALLAGSPNPPSASYLCLQSPQSSQSSNTTLVAPASAGYYPRWTDLQSAADPIDGTVSRIVSYNCVVVGVPAQPDIDHDCIGDVTEAGMGITPVLGNPSSSTDIDGDGLPNGLEVANGSSPTNPDADLDGANDFTELFQFTDPNNADTDGDGRKDLQNNLAGFTAIPPYFGQTNATDNCPTVANAVAASSTLTGTSTSAPTATTLTDSAATMTVNAEIGAILVRGASFATVTSNTATVFTFTGWAGGTPLTGAYTATLYPAGDNQNNTDSKPDNTLTPSSGASDVTNPHQDHQGDACDADDDNDGIGDVSEAALQISTASPGAGKTWCANIIPAKVGFTATTLDPLDADSDNDGGLDGLECQMTSDPSYRGAVPPAGTASLSRFPLALSGEDPDFDLLFAPSNGNAAAEQFFHTTSIAIGGQACPAPAPAGAAGCSIAFGQNFLNNSDGDACGAHPSCDGVFDSDSDNDGLGDGPEVKFYDTSPGNPDTDGDGCIDGREAGDINGDRKVNATDLQQVAGKFGSIRTGATGVIDQTKTNYDFNKDGSIAAADLQGIAKVFGNCVAQGGTTPISGLEIPHA